MKYLIHRNLFDFRNSSGIVKLEGYENLPVTCYTSNLVEKVICSRATHYNKKENFIILALYLFGGSRLACGRPFPLTLPWATLLLLQ